MRGPLLCARRPRLRPGAGDLQRHVRPAPGADRVLPRGCRCNRFGAVRRPAPAAHGGPRGRPQRSRQLHVRARLCHRPFADERGPRGSEAPHRAGSGRRDVGQCGSGDAGVRTRNARRDCLAYGCGRTGAEWRNRVAAKQVRADLRQPGVGRGGYRGRGGPHGERQREPGSCSGLFAAGAATSAS